jgi:multiple sugar transport system ATP-binding protein
MNVFPTRLRPAADETFQLEFGKERLHVPPETISAYGSPENLLDRPLLAGLRPEAFSPADEAAGANRLGVRVAASEALGHENLIYFDSPAPSASHEKSLGGNQPRRSGEGHMAARLAATGSPPSTGQEIALAVDTGGLVLFDREGKRLAERH